MSKKTVHVVPGDCGWAVKDSGNSRATSVHDTQAQAIEAARELTKNQRSELLIHELDGQIRAKDSYGKDFIPSDPAPTTQGVTEEHVESRAPTGESKGRITARVRSSVQSLLEEAAAYLGVPLNSFLVSAAVEKAGEVLAAERTIRLSHRDAEFFASVMENPPGPNPALYKAAHTYRDTISE